MKKIKILLLGILAIITGIFSANLSLDGIKVSASGEVTPYTLDFSDEDLSSKLTSVYIPTAYGNVEDISEHWEVGGDVIKRVNDCGGDDVTGNYAVNYLNGAYFRYFDLTTKVAYGQDGLTGIIFAKKDLTIRHIADGNALYFMPDPSVEIAGSTITHSITSSRFSEKDGFYELRIVVCADYIKVYVDGALKIDETLPAELLDYGRIGLFTANAAGSFSDGVEIYNVDEHGERIPLEDYVAATGVEINSPVVDMLLSDEGVKLDYSIVPSNATVKDVRFLSSSPDIAIVDNDGYIHPLKAGVTEIQVIALDGGFKGSLIVNITEEIPELEGITISMTSATIDKIDGKLYLQASSYPEDAENLGFKWKSTNPKVAYVMNGTVYAVSEGTCDIEVRDWYGNFVAKCTVTVKFSDASNSNEKDTGKGCNGSLGLGAIGLPLAFIGTYRALKKKED